MPKFGIRNLFVVVLLAALICSLFAPVIWSARHSLQRMKCYNNLRTIGVALSAYESHYRSLPNGVETDSTGKLLHSWRSKIYPSLIEQSAPYYDRNSSWDSKTNMRILNSAPIPMKDKDGKTSMVKLGRFPPVFVCPSCDENHLQGVNYVVVLGEKTAFPKSRGVMFADITDGLENTILFVESINCTPDWTEPRDLEFDTMSFQVNAKEVPSISGHHRDGPFVCFADFAVFQLTKKSTETEIKSMLTIAGDEQLSRDELISRGVLIPY